MRRRERNREGQQDHDADPRFTYARYLGLWPYSGRSERRAYLLHQTPYGRRLSKDDPGGYGTAFLLYVPGNGYHDYLWLLYEKN